MRICLAIQLTADRQIRRLTKESPVVVVDDSVLVILRDIVQIHRRHLEHLTCTLAVASGDERRVHIDEASLLEELMNRIGDQRTHAEHRLKRVGARTQMRHRYADTPELWRFFCSG